MNRKAFMKKILPLLFLMVACTTLVVVAQQNQEDPIAVILRINGSLDWREAAGGDWKPGQPKQPLFNGNQIRTAVGNRAIIVYTSGTRILVNENTELEILAQVPPQKGAKPTTERTKLIVGEVYSKIRATTETQTGYEVETPSSVASVRGTEFNASFRNGIADFLVLLNEIYIANAQGSQSASQYQQVTVTQGQAPGAPQQLSQNQAQQRTSWTQNVEPIWRLNMVPQGGENQPIGADFSINIWAISSETGSIDNNATFKLSSFAASTDIVQFSADGGKTWASTPEISIVNGMASLLVRGSEQGQATITAAAPDCEPAALRVNFSQPKDKKIIELIFNNPDGTQESIMLEIEEK